MSLHSAVLVVWCCIVASVYGVQSQYQSELAGVTRLCCCEGQPVVCSGGTDGVVRAWDLRSGQLEREWHGHSGSVLDLTLLQ